MVVGAHNSHSYAAMRLSQQAFSGGNVIGGGNATGGYANQALNQSMGLPLQQTVNSSIDLNNSALINNPLNNTSGVVSRPQQLNSKNAAKQYLNTSFDASKSANTINYVNSAYMSAAMPPTQSTVPGPSGKALSKVGLKQHNQ